VGLGYRRASGPSRSRAWLPMYPFRLILLDLPGSGLHGANVFVRRSKPITTVLADPEMLLEAFDFRRSQPPEHVAFQKIFREVLHSVHRALIARRRHPSRLLPTRSISMIESRLDIRERRTADVIGTKLADLYGGLREAGWQVDLSKGHLEAEALRSDEPCMRISARAKIDQ